MNKIDEKNGNMRGVTVAGALAVETEVARRGDEESLEKISLRQRVDLSRDVQRSPGDGDRPAKAKQPIEVEGCDLGVVSLKVREVEVVGQRLLGAGEPHRLEKRLAPVLKLDDQLQLGSPLLLADPNDGQALHPSDRLPYGLLVGPIHLLLGHPKLELLPHILSRDLAALRQGKLCQAVNDKFDNCDHGCHHHHHNVHQHGVKHEHCNHLHDDHTWGWVWKEVEVQQLVKPPPVPAPLSGNHPENRDWRKVICTIHFFGPYFLQHNWNFETEFMVVYQTMSNIHRRVQ